MRQPWGDLALRDESDLRRAAIAALIARMDLRSLVVVAAPVARGKQERARRICIETLPPALEQMESRRSSRSGAPPPWTSGT